MWWWPVVPSFFQAFPSDTPAPTPPPARPSLRITCRIHLETRWEGHLICRNCGRMWQRTNPAAPYFAPADGRCKCDKKLAPTRRADPHARGRPICPRCFDERAALRRREDRKASLLICRLIGKKKKE